VVSARCDPAHPLSNTPKNVMHLKTDRLVRVRGRLPNRAGVHVFQSATFLSSQGHSSDYVLSFSDGFHDSQKELSRPWSKIRKQHCHCGKTRRGLNRVCLECALCGSAFSVVRLVKCDICPWSLDRGGSTHTQKCIWINKSLVNPKSTSNQSSKPCTVLQYPSRKVRYLPLKPRQRWCNTYTKMSITRKNAIWGGFD